MPALLKVSKHCINGAQAEAAGKAHGEALQRMAALEARSLELEIILEGLQAELGERTAELREEVCSACSVTENTWDVHRICAACQSMLH